MKMTRFTRFIWLLIAAIGFLGFAGAAIAQGRGAIVSISRLGQGTATNPEVEIGRASCRERV